jgi:hypothetical protein
MLDRHYYLVSKHDVRRLDGSAIETFPPNDSVALRFSVSNNGFNARAASIPLPNRKSLAEVCVV